MTDDATAPSHQLTITERDMLGALEVLERASDDPDVLLVLSDEELLGIDGDESLTALGSPFLDREGVDRETAAMCGLRGLIARRMINPTDQAREDEGELLVGEGDPSTRLIQLELGLAGIVSLRRIPEAMIVVDRIASQVRTRLGVYLFPNGVLEEFVAADGFHHFCVPTREVLTERISEFVDPFATAADDGEVQEIAAADVDSLHDLGDTRTLSTITVVSPENSHRATIFELSDRVRVLDNGDADPDTVEGDDLLQISDVSAASLRGIVESLLPDVAQDAS